MKPFAVAILLSGSGSNMQALLDAQYSGTLGAVVTLVISDRADAYGLQRALGQQIPCAFVPLPRVPPSERAAARQAWEQRLLAMIGAYQPDLIVSSGFMRILSADFLAACGVPVINQHPALLPDGGGNSVISADGTAIPALRGAHVVPDALAQGLPITGCTVHLVTPLVDDGPVLARAEVPILPDDDVVSLHERIKVAERCLIIEVVKRFAARGTPC